MTDEEVLTSLTEILSRDFSIAAAKITKSATFRGTLGLDSMDVVDLIGFLEKRFDLKAGLDAYRDLDTVGKLVAFVVARKN